MKAEIELTIDSRGMPIITFRHHDKDNSLEQKLLKVFIDNALIDGIAIQRGGGYLEMGTTNSWEDYRIVTKQK